MADAGVEDRGVMTAFMQALGVYGTTGRLGEALIALCKKQFNGFGWEK
ncbi:putative acetyltransferase [Escherichia coli]|nr:putative acetyltransferase [Escherichia coli]